MTTIPKGFILSDLKRVYRLRGGLSRVIYAGYGKYSPSSVVREFGSFSNGVKMAGIVPNKIGGNRLAECDEVILGDLKRVCEKYGVSQEIYGKYGRFSCGGTINRRFGSFNEAIRRTGSKPNSVGAKVGNRQNFKNRNFEIDDGCRNYIDGLIASDGTVVDTGASGFYRQACIFKDWLEHINDSFEGFGMEESGVTKIRSEGMDISKIELFIIKIVGSCRRSLM